MPDNPGAPLLGQPSMNADDVDAAYRQAFSGRSADAREMASELENANKYGAAGILNSIAARTNNAPGSGDQGTATAASLGLALPVRPATPPSAPLPLPTPRLSSLSDLMALAHNAPGSGESPSLSPAVTAPWQPTTVAPVQMSMPPSTTPPPLPGTSGSFDEWMASEDQREQRERLRLAGSGGI